MALAKTTDIRPPNEKLRRNKKTQHSQDYDAQTKREAVSHDPYREASARNDLKSKRK
jgi:hypothetical protein